MPAPSADRNLLFGILALQLDFVTRDALIGAMSAWVLDKSKSLGDILRDQGHLSAERLQLLTALVNEHLKQHGDDPHQSLAALASLDPSLGQQLQSMADAGGQASLAHVGPTTHDTSRADDSLAGFIPVIPSPVTTVRYRVLRPHAKGGLGEVFVARDIELGREVALKEIRPDRASDLASRRRFVQEAEVTGNLEHPGVVPVYGLGAHPNGGLYYAMRFVRGDTLQEAIRRYHADMALPPGKRALAFRELLSRFVAVCQAVAYAHSRGVLHRDLKPGNVMLGKYGETYVVDWGLAKPQGRCGKEADGEATLWPRPLAESMETEAGQALGTPAYMSPEQADGRLDELGPASDVYSLGATLYELLTGQTPFEAKHVVTILEDVRVGRFPPPRRVHPDAPPALEAVCLRAMALRPEDRYPTAVALAAEIEHWLADEPVSAWREPAGVRVWRWVRRHGTLMTGVAALTLTAVVALAVGFALVSREQAATAKERDEKEQARQRTRQALNTLTDGVIDRLFARQVQLGEDERRFLRDVQRFYEEFAAAGGDTPEARASQADGSFRVGSTRRKLGERTEAEAAYRAALAVQEKLAGDYPTVPDYRYALARTHLSLGIVLSDTGRPQEAEDAYRKAVELLERLAVEYPAVPKYRSALADGHNNLGILLRAAGRPREAEDAYRAALAAETKLADDHPTVPQYRADVAKSQYNLGIRLRAAGRLPEAEAAYGEALTAQESLVADFPAVPDYRVSLASTRLNLGILLKDTDRPGEAEAAYREALAVFARLAADFPAVPDYRDSLARTYNNLGALLYITGRPREGEDAFRAALALTARLATDFPDTPAYTNAHAVALRNLAELHQRRKDFAQARELFEQALPYHQAALRPNPRHPVYRRLFGETVNLLALTLAALGDHAATAAKAEELAGLDVHPANNAYDAACCLALCVPAAAKDSALDESRRVELVESYGRRAVGLLRQAFAKGYKDVAHMLEDADLDALRRRADYADLLWDLADLPALQPTDSR